MPMRLEKTLPSSFYLSRRIFRREKERIFFREWLCAGREEEIPSPGDYLVLDVAGESILVVRTRAGARERNSRKKSEWNRSSPG